LFPSVAEILGDEKHAVAEKNAAEDWTTLRSVRDEVLKALEEARNNKLIGTGLEAQVNLTAPDPVYSVLSRHADQLRYLFIVSAVTLAQGSGNGTGSVHVEVKKADGLKCERCWNYSIHVGEDKKYPTVCERCSAVLKELEGNK
jgi:isoleucyl-tRNA synthetase